MTTIETAPHEVEGNLNFVEHGLSPYWFVSELLFDHYDGHGELEREIESESWRISLSYQKGGIALRPTDSIDTERLYEFRIALYGDGQRKANFHVRPRFTGMQHYESGERINSPFDHKEHSDEGVNDRYAGSNIEPDEYAVLLPWALRALAENTGAAANLTYFTQPAETSNVTTYERYVRLRRSMAEKVTQTSGIMNRIFQLLADEEGSEVVLALNNSEIVGYNHRLKLPTEFADDLIPTHHLGKQILPSEHVRTEDNEDPLYHPKIGVLVKKSLTGHTIVWNDREDIRREIDETLINLLEWADIPTKPESTTYIADDHFAPRDGRDIVRYDDPTPEIEAKQEAMLVTTLRDMTAADVEVLETLVADGAGQHPEELADGAGKSISTVYRSLKRLEGIIRNDGASVGWTSQKIATEIIELIESVEYQLKNAADRVAKMLDVERRQASSSAFQQWLDKYAVELVETPENGRMKLRIDTILSRLKSSQNPHVADVFLEGARAWKAMGRDPLVFREAAVKWKIDTDAYTAGTVGAAMR